MQKLFLLKLSDNGRKTLIISAIVGGCAVIHTPAYFIQHWLRYASTAYGAPNLNDGAVLYTLDAMRALLFLASIAVLIATFAMPVAEYFLQRKAEYDGKKILLNGLAVFIATGILVLPSRLGLMGVGYGEMSKDPFSFQDTTDQVYQRLLMPGIAYFLQFKGPLLYYIFSLLLTLALIFSTLLFLRTRGVQTSFLENVSIAVSSFIVTQFQSPGYTEQLSLIIILFLVMTPLGLFQKIAGVALALFSHEVSILVLFVVGYLYFSREEKIWTGFIILIYVAFWLVSFGLDPVRLLAVRTVGDQSGLSWLFTHPYRELSGVALSYKLLWVPLIVALGKAVDRKEIAFLVLPGIVATIFGVDTTRLMAFSFLGFLFAIVAVKKYALIKERPLRLLFGLNLCIPSVYIGLNSGLYYFDGLYQLIFRGSLLR
ncbi:MAG TPA: hypothetical protein VMM58_07510 [Bacteroidota bacterium]|nr:hypothetical protein [Bacteroidota bacterium]